MSLLHPKAGYLALNGCVPFMDTSPQHRTHLFGAFRREGERRHLGWNQMPDNGEPHNWSVWPGNSEHFIWELCTWDAGGDWDMLSWDLIKEFCHEHEK